MMNHGKPSKHTASALSSAKPSARTPFAGTTKCVIALEPNSISSAISSRVLTPGTRKPSPEGCRYIFRTRATREEEMAGQAAKEILDAFQNASKKRYGEDAVDPGRRCATVEFEKNTKDEEGKVLSIDTVPACELNDCYKIPDRISANGSRPIQRCTSKNRPTKTKRSMENGFPS